jgi:hypothetical protein
MGHVAYGLNQQESTCSAHDCIRLTLEASTLAPQG